MLGALAILILWRRLFDFLIVFSELAVLACVKKVTLVQLAFQCIFFIGCIVLVRCWLLLVYVSKNLQALDISLMLVDKGGFGLLTRACLIQKLIFHEMRDVVSAVQLLEIPMLVPEEALIAELAVLRAQYHVGAEEIPAIAALELIAMVRDASLTELLLPVGVPTGASGALVGHDPVEAHSVLRGLGLRRFDISLSLLEAARHELRAGLELRARGKWDKLWACSELGQLVLCLRHKLWAGLERRGDNRCIGCGIEGRELRGLRIECLFILGQPWVIL